MRTSRDCCRSRAACAATFATVSSVSGTSSATCRTSRRRARACAPCAGSTTARSRGARIRAGRAMPSAGDVQRWRAEFPISARLIYLNNCSLTPLPTRGATALAEYARTWTELGGRAWYQHWVGLLDDLRADFARILGADVDEVALEPAVSAALVTIASSFDYAKRNKVVVADIDFPTDGHTWLALEKSGVAVA